METSRSLSQYALCTCISHLDYGNEQSLLQYALYTCISHLDYGNEQSLLQYALYTCISNLDCYSMCYTRSLVVWTMETSTSLSQYVLYVHQSPALWKRALDFFQYALYTCISHLDYGNEHVIHVHQSPALRAGTDPDPLPTCM